MDKATIIYLASSVSLQIINKHLFTKYDIDLTCTLLLCQQITTFIILRLFLNVSPSKLLKERTFLDHWPRLLGFSIIFIFQIVFSFICSKYVNTQLYQTLRKFNLVMNIGYDFLVNDIEWPYYINTSCILITFGGLVSSVSLLTSEGNLPERGLEILLPLHFQQYTRTHLR